MAYFDPEKNTELYTDASDVGLGAIICQHDPGSKQRKIIAYASRSLTDVEKRYSTTEKEALAIVYVTDKFRLYLFGHHFTLYTDHRPVQLIFGNPMSRPPARIERWQLRLQEFSFDIHYLPGPQTLRTTYQDTTCLQPRDNVQILQNTISILLPPTLHRLL